MEKLQWKVKHDIDFSEEVDFLETILHSDGVENIEAFLSPSYNCTYNPFLLDNMEKGIQLLHDNIDKKIFIKVDCDTDGFTSAAVLKKFIEKLNPKAEIEYRLDFNKRHGLFYENVAHYKKGELGLIIIPDASIIMEEVKQIRDNLGEVPILIIDHHEIEEDNIGMLNEATVINCMLGDYPNKCLSGVGVVYKFCCAYCEKYNYNISNIDYFLDLVALGIIADSMSLKSLENRYYIIEGLTEVNIHNEFVKEYIKRHEEDFKLGVTIYTVGWYIGPAINAVIRYGKPEEQIDLFRAICGEQDDREYQPRRKSKNDPIPPVEIHSLQKTMARVCDNVRNRQNTEVRNFMKKIDEEITKNELDKNSVIVVDGSNILTKNTVTGLVANKIATKYKRPVLMLKSFTKDEFGGSGRNYGLGNLENFKDFLNQFDLFDGLMGHAQAFGIRIKKDKIQELIDCCNKALSIESLSTIHQVDYEIQANKLKLKDVQKVANSYKIWGNDIPEPMFVITNLRINAKDIQAYGENESFIRFVYKGIPFIKKYCPKGDYKTMVLADRRMVGGSKKELNMNLICSFVLNEYEGKVFPQVKIWFYDSEEYKPKPNEIDDDWIF